MLALVTDTWRLIQSRKPSTLNRLVGDELATMAGITVLHVTSKTLRVTWHKQMHYDILVYVSDRECTSVVNMFICNHFTPDKEKSN